MLSNLTPVHTPISLKIAKDFLNGTLKDIMSLVGADSGSLFLFDPDKKELILDSYLNSQQLEITNIKRRIGEGISGKVVETHDPVLVSDIDTDPRFRRNGFNHYHTKSFISIPLFCSDRLFGLVNIADKSSGDSFSEKDLLCAVTLCKYASLNVEHLLSAAQLQDEKEKLATQKTLLEKYATVGKLAAGIVHELNNPLDGIIRYTNIMLSQLDEKNSISHSVAKEYLLEIKKGLSRIVTITKSLLEFSHLINSESHKPKKYVDIYSVIDESLDLFKEKINGSIQVIKCYNTHIPALVDMGISHVFVNLIKNAIDAMPQGGTLELVTDIKDSSVRLGFKDTGVGIPVEIKGLIFEPFFTTKSIDKGTGLGLAIAKEIIHKYEGRIEVESTVGAGTLFLISIPKKHLIHA